MPSINNSTVEVELDINLDSEEFKSLSDRKGSCNSVKIYRGSQEQLANAGVPLPLFPGQPGRRKTITKFTIKGGEARLTRLQGKTIKYNLVWWIPEHLRAIEDPGIEAAMKAPLASPARLHDKMERKSKLILLDFVDHDAIAALKYLITLFEENKAAGIVFAVALTHDRKRDHLFGVSGRPALNLVEALGMTALLQHNLLNQYPD